MAACLFGKEKDVIPEGLPTYADFESGTMLRTETGAIALSAHFKLAAKLLRSSFLLRRLLFRRVTSALLADKRQTPP